jgi:hypothetical protein
LNFYKIKKFGQTNLWPDSFAIKGGKKRCFILSVLWWKICRFAICGLLTFADMRYAAPSREICGLEIFGLTYLRNLGIFDSELSPRIWGFKKLCMPTFANLPLSTILAAKLPLVHLEL